MSELRKAAEQALRLLDAYATRDDITHEVGIVDVPKALRAALAADEQSKAGRPYSERIARLEKDPKRKAALDRARARVRPFLDALAAEQPAQEPVAWRYLYSDGCWRFSNGKRVNGGDPIYSQPLYAHPYPAPSEPTVTDVMVVAACRAFSEAAFGDAAETCREYMIRSGPMRAALVAALAARGDAR